jgi:Cd2+/Zn2+-exporting ATPase
MNTTLQFRYDAALDTMQTRQGIEVCTMLLEKRSGRLCESCSANIENRIRAFPGVTTASASFVGGTMTVKFDPAATRREAIIANVSALGVGLIPLDAAPRKGAEPDAPAGWAAFREWVFSERGQAAFTVITFAGMLAGLALENRFAAPVPSLIAYGIAYLTGGIYGLKAGMESLAQRAIDVDFLMILAAVGAGLVGAPFEGVMLLFLFSLSNVLTRYAFGRTTSAIRALMEMRPDAALVRRGAAWLEVHVEAIAVGDLVLVRPGERIPLDGEVEKGESAVDQSPITGESVPVERGAGDLVLAGTINQHGALEIRVTRLAKDSTIARLIQMVAEAQSEKAKTQRFIERLEQRYAAGVIIMTALAIVVPIVFFAEPFAAAFYRAMTLMVAASPCAVVISTPATVLSAIGNGARRGVLFKGGAHVEAAAGIKVAAFDKTGTLTYGKPAVTDIVTVPGWEQAAILQLAASVEQVSEHPLARAVVQAAQARGLALEAVVEFQAVPGRGVHARTSGGVVNIGNARYFEENHIDASPLAGALADLQGQGKTAILAAVDGRIAAVIAVADMLRENVRQIIQAVKASGVTRTVMLTGDHAGVAKHIAGLAGLDDFHASLLPEDKLRIIGELEAQYGAVAMVGDGVNDAPALAAATLGIAMGAAGTDVALETADIVLMSDDLANIPYLLQLSRRTRQTLVQNLVFALGVILILIGAVLGFALALPLSVIGHEGSTVLVSLNGLRLLAFRERAPR